MSSFYFEAFEIPTAEMDRAFQDTTVAVFPFGNVDLSNDGLNLTSENGSFVPDGGLSDEYNLDDSAALYLDEFFYGQDMLQAAEFYDATNAESRTDLKPCTSPRHSRVVGFAHANPEDGALCVVRCLAIDEREEWRLEKLLEVLDRFVDSRGLDSPRRRAEPLDELERTDLGSPFLQEIFDVFCEDEKVHIIHGFHERTLEDSIVKAWFHLPILPTSSSSSIFNLDPDGTFFQRCEERNTQDVLFSLRVLATELTLGLLFLHEKGIVHLGVQLSNILVTPSGNVQISDFGSANILPRLPLAHVDPSDFGCVHPTVDIFSNKSGAGSVVSLMALGSGFGQREEMGLSGDDDNLCSRHYGRNIFGSLTLGLSEAIKTTRFSAPELSDRDEQGRLVFDERADWWSLGIILCDLGYDEGIGPGNLGECEDRDLKDFIYQLTREREERPAGDEIQKHKFLAIESVFLHEILDLRYPPCPARNTTSSPPYEEKNETVLPPIYIVTSPPVGNGSSGLASFPVVGQGSANALEETFVYEGTHSDIQPFPSTASLYPDVWTHPIQEEDEESVETSLALEAVAPHDGSGLVSNKPFAILVDGPASLDLDDDGSPIVIRAPSLKELDFTFSPSFNPILQDFKPDAEKQRVDTNMNEMLALSFLRDRNGGNEILARRRTRAVSLYQSGIRIKRQVQAVRSLPKASKRAVKHVRKFIIGVIQCR